MKFARSPIPYNSCGVARGSKWIMVRPSSIGRGGTLRFRENYSMMVGRKADQDLGDTVRLGILVSLESRIWMVTGLTATSTQALPLPSEYEDLNQVPG